MELTHAHLRYLLAAYELSEQAATISSAKIAGRLGVSRPSVARMLGVLAERELVTKERYGKVTLTKQGAAAARCYLRQIQLLAEQISSLGFDLSREELFAAAGALASALGVTLTSAALCM